MLYQGVGWIRPTRLAPEGSPFFAVPGGSLAGLSDLMTEVPLNGRLAGLGCGCSRNVAPGVGAMLDRNRRESLEGLRGAQMAMQGQPRGWGLGESTSGGVSWDVKEAAIAWANNAMSQALQIARDAKSIGGPGWLGWYSSSYYAKFAPLQDRVTALINEFVTKPGHAPGYEAELPADIRHEVSSTLTDVNASIKAVFDGLYEESVFDRIINTLQVLPSWVYEVTVTETGERVGEAVAGVKRIGKTIGDLADSAASIGKWVTIAVVAAAALYGMSFLPRGRG